MNVRDLERMPLDDLWNLHERIVAILDVKLVQETRKLEEKLNELGRRFGRAPPGPSQRRPYPKVPQNIEIPISSADVVRENQAASLGQNVNGERCKPRGPAY